MTNDARRWAGRIGRVGYAARAAVYCLIAGMALDAVLRLDPDEPRGVVGVMHAIARRPGGRAVMAILAIGFAAQVVWRAVQALGDVEHPHGHEPHWWTRIGWSFVGLFYAGLCVRTVQFAIGRPGHGHKRTLVERVLAYPEGRVLIFGIGAGLVIFFLVELYRAWRAPFLGELDERVLTRTRRRTVSIIGRVGLVGRGLVFGAGGVLLARSAWRARADTVNTGDVLRHLFTGPFGAPVVGAIAVCLFAYAALMIVEAAWRRNLRRL